MTRRAFLLSSSMLAPARARTEILHAVRADGRMELLTVGPAGSAMGAK